MQDFLCIETAGDGSSIMAVGIQASGKLILGPSVSPPTPTSGNTVLSANTWYRLTLSYVITNATNYTMKLFLNGTLEITVTQAAGTLLHTATSDLIIGMGNSGIFGGTTSVMDVWYDDLYVDNGTTLDDPGNISVTNKRAYSNGTTNGFTTTGTPSGYGSGHASYVNGNYPVGSDTTTYVSAVVVASAITEEFTIEGASVGDANLTGTTIKGVRGWVFASSTLTETDTIVVDGTQTSITVTSTPTLFVQNSPNPTTYPAGTGTDIGMVTNTTAATAKLFGAGILIAYIPAAPSSGLFMQTPMNGLGIGGPFFPTQITRGASRNRIYLG